MQIRCWVPKPGGGCAVGLRRRLAHPAFERPPVDKCEDVVSGGVVTAVDDCFDRDRGGIRERSGEWEGLVRDASA